MQGLGLILVLIARCVHNRHVHLLLKISYFRGREGGYGYAISLKVPLRSTLVSKRVCAVKVALIRPHSL